MRNHGQDSPDPGFGKSGTGSSPQFFKDTNLTKTLENLDFLIGLHERLWGPRKALALELGIYEPCL
jgi:hypothetical protein